jgi:hypothetical protein
MFVAASDSREMLGHRVFGRLDHLGRYRNLIGQPVTQRYLCHDLASGQAWSNFKMRPYPRATFSAAC